MGDKLSLKKETKTKIAANHNKIILFYSLCSNIRKAS